jgi:hypothetical protein
MDRGLKGPERYRIRAPDVKEILIDKTVTAGTQMRGSKTLLPPRNPAGKKETTTPARRSPLPTEPMAGKWPFMISSALSLFYAPSNGYLPLALQ